MKIMVVGSQGNMGALACRSLEEDKRVTQVIGVRRQDNLDGMLRSHQPHVLLELTDKDSVKQNCIQAIGHRVPVVVGASGLSDSDVSEIKAMAQVKDTSVLIVPNFSVAAVLMIQSARKIARYLSDCEIIEYHHANKKDAPSATSLYTAKQVAQGLREGKREEKSVSGKGIPIHSIRSTGFVAQQDVVFGQQGENLTLSLSQINREAFMPGVLMSVMAVRQLSSGVHVGLECIMNSDIDENYS